MAESENDPLNTLIDAPTLDDGSIPKSVGESDGYVDCSLALYQGYIDNQPRSSMELLEAWPF